MFYRECPNLQSRLARTLLLLTLGTFLFACGSSTAKFLARGEEYLTKRKFHDALMQFRSAVESDKNSAKAHWGMARSYENLGQFSAALEELRKTTELDDSNLEAKSKLGNYFLLVQPAMIAEAEKIQEQVAAADPKFIEGVVLKASILAAQSRPDTEVVAKINEAIAIDPKRTETYLSLSRYYMTNERGADAEAAIQKGISMNPEQALGLIEYGRVLTYAARDAEAEVQFNKAIAVGPANIEAHEARADFFVISKQTAKAEAEYKNLVVIQENSPESRLVLAEFYAGSSQTSEAVAVLEQIVADAPHYVRARYRVGQIYLEQKDAAKVKEQLTALFKINDNDVDALMLRARLKLQENRSDDAVKDLENILKKQPSQRDALFYISQAKIAIGQIDQARAFISDLERYHPTFLKGGLLKIQAAFSAGESDLALKSSKELLDKVSAATPNADTGVQALYDLQVKALTSRGLAYLELGKLIESRGDLEKVFAMTPTSSPAMVNLAKVYTAENDAVKALEFYEKALVADATNFDAMSGIVSISIDLNRMPQAHAKVAELIAANAGRSDVLAALHYLKSQVYSAEKNTASQESELTQSIALDENYLPSYSSFAALLARRNQTPEAIAQYQKVVDRKPSASVYTLLGILEDSRGNRADAEKHYRRALEIAPETPIAANNLAWLIVENKGNLDEALQLATASVAKNQTVAGFYDTLGWVYLKKGLYSPAVQQMRKAIALDEKTGKAVTPGYRVRLGIALAYSGDKVSARREVETSLRSEGEMSQKEITDAKKVLASL